MGLLLVNRAGCHLCQEAEEALVRAGIDFRVADVDADAELVRLYDLRVPVLLSDGRVVAEGRIGTAQVERLPRG